MILLHHFKTLKAPAFISCTKKTSEYLLLSSTENHTGLERHEGKYLMTEFSFLVELFL